MNCIEFLVKDEHGDLHGGRIMQEEGSKELFTKEEMERIESGFRAEGFKVLKIQITNIH